VKLLRSYFFWTYDRGSLHYDVMVTLILAFLFISPHFIDFKDKPVPPVPLHSSEVLIKSARATGRDDTFVYEIRVEDLHGASTDAQIRSALLDMIEPIAGDITLEAYTPVRDAAGRIVAYDATVLR
jgi:hypothetical protein